MTRHTALTETVQWLKEMGEETVVGPTPQSWFKPAPRESEERGACVTPTLERLRSQFEAFTGCALKETAMNLVFGDGHPQAPIMVIGEAPGAEEDREGRPFVGMSGQLLDRIFAAMGWTRQQELYITNMIPWRPPGNRQPTPHEVASCLPFLKAHIECVRPKVIICAGAVSAKALLETTEGISKIRGRLFPYVLEDGTSLPIMPTYHPAFLLRSPSRKQDVWFDLLRLREKLGL